MKRFLIALAAIAGLILASPTVETQSTSTTSIVLFPDATDITSLTNIFCDTGSTYPADTVLACTTGSAADDGFIDVAGFGNVVIVVDVDAVDDTIDVDVEARYRDQTTPGTDTQLIHSFTSITTAGVSTHTLIIPADQIRVGVRVNATTGSAEDVEIIVYRSIKGLTTTAAAGAAGAAIASGSGTANTVVKFDSTPELADSQITDNGVTVTLPAATDITGVTANTLIKLGSGGATLVDSLFTDNGTDVTLASGAKFRIAEGVDDAIFSVPTLTADRTITIGDDSINFASPADNNVLTYDLGTRTWSGEASAGGFALLTETGVPGAGLGGNIMDQTYTLNAMNGSDTINGFTIVPTNADHMGAGNIYNVLNIGNITGDVEASERAFVIGSGYDIQIVLNSSENRIETIVGNTIGWFATDANDVSLVLSTISSADALVLTVGTDFGANTDLFSLTGTTQIMNGSDTENGIDIQITNADHTGAGNALNAINIGAITGDVDATETAIELGAGWDIAIHIGDLESGTNPVDSNSIVFGDSNDAFIGWQGSNLELLFDVGNENSGDSFFFNAGNGGGNDLLQIAAANVSVYDFARVPAAGASGDMLTITDTLLAMNGADTVRGILINLTNGSHTGAGNSFNAIDIAAITASANAQENILHIPDGWEFFIDITEALGTNDATTALDKTANTAAGTIRVEVNGTLLHIQLFAD